MYNTLLEQVMFKLLYVTLCFLIVNVSAQDNFKKLENLGEDKAREKALDIIEMSRTYDFPTQKKAYDTLEYLVNYYRLDSLRIATYVKKGRYELFVKQDVKKALQYFTNARELAIQQNNPRLELDILTQIAQVYNNTGVTDKAVETLLELKTKAEEIGDSTNISAAYFQLGISNVNISGYSIRMFKKSLEYSQHNPYHLPNIYSNLGQAYLLINPSQPDSARFYLEIANELNDSIKKSPAIPLTLAEAYIELNEFDKADSLIDQALGNSHQYNSYDISILAYYLKIKTLQHFGLHAQAGLYVQKGLEKLKMNFYDDYDIVDFCREAKKTLVELKDFGSYRIIDSIETVAQDSIVAYIVKSNISRSENEYELDTLENELSLKENEIAYKNFALVILAILLFVVVLAGYQTLSKRRLKDQLKKEGEKFSQIKKDQKNLIQEKEVSQANVSKLEVEMAQKIQQQERQLASHVLTLTHKNNLMSQMLTRIKNYINANEHNSEIEELERLLEDSLKNEDHWKTFLIHFENVHPEFYKKLDAISKDITKQDKRILSYLKMRLTSKEIAQLLGVNYESVNTSRYRLRKKLNLEKGVELDDYIASL